MNPWLLDYLCDPADGGPLKLMNPVYDKKGRIISGTLAGKNGLKYPILRGIPRFVPASLQPTVTGFGDQWNHFNFDDFYLHWREHTVKNTFGKLGWFKGKTVVDCGAGHGMQSRWMVESGAKRVIALELSHAVDDVFQRNLKGFEDTIAVVQCSIDNPPLKAGSIRGLVMCHNVIQHTPNVERTAKALWKTVGSGGEFAFNCYTRDDSSPIRRARFALHMGVRHVLQASPFAVRWLYSQLMGLLVFVPGLGKLLEKAMLLAGGDVPPGPQYLRRKWRATVVNTFDGFGGHDYQWHLSLDEQRALAKQLQPDTKKWVNPQHYFSRPMPIGCALRLKK